MNRFLAFGSSVKALRIARSMNGPSLSGLRTNSAGVGKLAIQVGISEVILFVMYQVFAGVITNINLTGVFKGTNGVLVNLVTLFYLLGAALTPLALVKHAGFL
ncbi:MAG TPA: hypothetical protein VEP90_30290 [Methylomirabilota bacterium]|nr:hypothetical protein [Methylomirabilota bacterium]